MIYISKGIVCEGSTENILRVTRCGRDFNLTGSEAYTWLNGRFGFAKSMTNSETAALTHLVKMGLVEADEQDNRLSRYRILSRCIICPAKRGGIQKRLNAKEKRAYTWLRFAGVRLTTAELIYLTENQIEPTVDVLYESNRQALIERIYTVDTVADNILESQMEKAVCRDFVVDTIVNLIRKKRAIAL